MPDGPPISDPENYEECPKKGCILIQSKGEIHGGPCLAFKEEEEEPSGQDK